MCRTGEKNGLRNICPMDIKTEKQSPELHYGNVGLSDFEDFVTRTGIEIAAGKAPDIFFGSSIFGDAAISLIEREPLWIWHLLWRRTGSVRRITSGVPMPVLRRRGAGIFLEYPLKVALGRIT